MKELTSKDMGRLIVVEYNKFEGRTILEDCLIVYIDNYIPDEIHILVQGEKECLGRIIDGGMVKKIGKRVFPISRKKA